MIFHFFLAKFDTYLFPIPYSSYKSSPITRNTQLATEKIPYLGETAIFHIDMNHISRFILKLSFLVIPFAIFAAILLDDTDGGSVRGGGGYDLSGLVYGTLLFAYIIIWLMWMLISYLKNMPEANRKMNLWLVMVGLGSLVVAWLITPNMF